MATVRLDGNCQCGILFKYFPFQKAPSWLVLSCLPFLRAWTQSSRRVICFTKAASSFFEKFVAESINSQNVGLTNKRFGGSQTSRDLLLFVNNICGPSYALALSFNVCFSSPHPIFFISLFILIFCWLLQLKFCLVFRLLHLWFVVFSSIVLFIFWHCLRPSFFLTVSQAS